MVAVSGWKLLNEGSHKDEAPEPVHRADYSGMAFYPLTLPITTGPGTIAVMISLGFARGTQATAVEELRFVAIILLAALVTAITIYVAFAYADRVERIIGHAGPISRSASPTSSCSACILWTGASELIPSLPAAITPAPK